MKTLTRNMIGVTSSLLSVAGLFRIAEKFDPLSQSLRKAPAMSNGADHPSQDCIFPCNYLPPEPSANVG